MKNRASTRRNASPGFWRFSSNVSVNNSYGIDAAYRRTPGLVSSSNDHPHGPQHADHGDRQNGKRKAVRLGLNPSDHVAEEKRSQGSKGIDLRQPRRCDLWPEPFGRERPERAFAGIASDRGDHQQKQRQPEMIGGEIEGGDCRRQGDKRNNIMPYAFARAIGVSRP